MFSNSICQKKVFAGPRCSTYQDFVQLCSKFWAVLLYLTVPYILLCPCKPYRAKLNPKTCWIHCWEVGSLLNQQPLVMVNALELCWQKGLLALKTLRKAWVPSRHFGPLLIPSNSTREAGVVDAVMQGEKPAYSQEKEKPARTHGALSLVLTHCYMQQATDSFSARIIPSHGFFSLSQIVCISTSCQQKCWDSICK